MDQSKQSFQKNILAIDLGNTSASICFFTPDSAEAKFFIKFQSKLLDSFPDEIPQSIKSFFTSVRDFIKTHNIEFQMWISSVVPDLNPKLEQGLSQLLFVSHPPPIPQFLNSSYSLPIKNLYATPHTLGSDRLAFVSYASIQFKGENVICIDAGTAITYDIITQSNTYLGGLILPGIHTVKNALVNNTSQLPDFQFKETDTLIGNSTVSCLEAGLYFGFKSQTERLVEMLKRQLAFISGTDTSQVIITGGDAELLMPFIEKSILVKDGVLMGLRLIGEWTKT